MLRHSGLQVPITDDQSLKAATSSWPPPPTPPSPRAQLRAAAATRGTYKHLAITCGVLCALVWAIYHFHDEPLAWSDRPFIMGMFSASNHSQLAGVLLLLFQLVSRTDGARGVSLQAQRFGCCASALRAYFAYYGAAGHNFYELVGATLAGAVVLMLLEPALARRLPHPRGGRFSGAVPDRFSAARMWGVALALAALSAAWHMWAQWATIVLAPGFSWRNLNLVIGDCAQVLANLLQAAAILPQRAMLIRARTLPALTSHAFALVSLSAVIRLVLWLLLCLELEFHNFPMLSDFVHVGLIADFALLYTRALREQGLEGMLNQQSVPFALDEV